MQAQAKAVPTDGEGVAFPGVYQACLWAVRVRDGEVAANEWVRLAAKRFLTDLDRAERKEGPWLFSAALAERVIMFCELLPNIKGPQADEQIQLMDWQRFIIANLFGFVDRTTGLRRFQQATVWVPRGNGKTSLMSTIALYVVFCEGEGGAEGYSAAVNKDQASICFDTAREMVRRSARIGEVFGVEATRYSIFCRETASSFKALSSDARGLEGLNVHFGVCDEIASHRTSAVYDSLVTAIAKRAQPLLVTISTAQAHTDGIGRDLWKYGEQVLSGSVQDERFFAIMFCAEDDDDPYDEATWEKANPGLDWTINRDSIRTLATQAAQSPSREHAFRTKHLNQWISANAALFSVTAWKQCEDAVPLEEQRGRPCFVGVDLSKRRDLTSWVAVFPEQGRDGEWHYSIYPRCYLPRSEVSQPGTDLFARLARKGDLTLHEGEEIDFNLVEQDIIAFAEQYDVASIGFDPWNAFGFVQRLTQTGHFLDVVEFAMSTRNLSAPTLELDAAIASRRVHHDGNEMLSFCIGNIVGRRDANGNVFPRRESDRQKIDAGIATIIAIGLAQASLAQSPPFEGVGVF